jgi:hypothetical protein
VLLGARRGSRVLTRRTLPLAAGERTVTLKPPPGGSARAGG